MYVENELLKSLGETDRRRISSHLKRKFFPAGATIGKKNDLIEEIFFPESGLISLVTELSDGHRIGGALIGRGGAVGASAALGTMRLPSGVVVLMPATGHVAPARAFLEIARGNDALCHALLANEIGLLVQAQQIAACNAVHNIAQRLCSWFLRAHDVTGSNQVTITQDALAHLLGIQRASVSLEASRLQDAGFIKYRRGTVELADIAGLQAVSCECAAAIRKDAAAMPRAVRTGTEAASPKTGTAPFA